MHIGLSIVFTGLCALVTGGRGGTGQMLLVDAKGVGAVGGVELPEHAATLVVSLSSLANAESSQPTRVVLAWPGAAAAGTGTRMASGSPEQVGLWDLAGSEVRIRVQGQQESGLRVFSPADGTSSWPEPPRDINNPAAWRDPRYLANMSQLIGDGRIDPALLTDAGGASSALPAAVAARIHLEGGVIEAGIPSHPAHRDDMFEFRAAAAEPRLRQALTDTVSWSLETADAAIVIEIIPVTGAPPRRLVLKPQAAPHVAFVSNLPVENGAAGAHHAGSKAEMAALHFGAYYKLLKSHPQATPLPWLWTSPGSRASTGVLGPFLCPPAMFEQD